VAFSRFPVFPFFTSVFDIDLVDAPRCTGRLNQTLYAQRSGGIFSNDFIDDLTVSRVASCPADRAGFLALRDRVWRVFISRHLTGKELDGLACLRVDYDARATSVACTKRYSSLDYN